jgi:hypothetical protein
MCSRLCTADGSVLTIPGSVPLPARHVLVLGAGFVSGPLIGERSFVVVAVYHFQLVSVAVDRIHAAPS